MKIKEKSKMRKIKQDLEKQIKKIKKNKLSSLSKSIIKQQPSSFYGWQLFQLFSEENIWLSKKELEKMAKPFFRKALKHLIEQTKIKKTPISKEKMDNRLTKVKQEINQSQIQTENILDENQKIFQKIMNLPI
jgi:CII-binding regulator of phage lambda lysogenization HflD